MEHKIMEILLLPTKWVSEEDMNMIDLGLKPKEPEPGWIYVNQHHIVAFNKSSDGNTTLRLANGESYIITMKIDEFIKLISS